MNFPGKFIKRGKFKLHSGEKSDKFYDVNEMLTDSYYLDLIIKAVPKDDVSYVGIATGGAIIASHFKPFVMVKDGKLKGELSGEYCLIDDVCTTEGSIKEAIRAIARKPKYIFVVLDRRKEKNLNLISLYEVD